MKKQLYTFTLATVTMAGVGISIGGAFCVFLLPIGCTIVGVAGPLLLADIKTSNCRDKPKLIFKPRREPPNDELKHNLTM